MAINSLSTGFRTCPCCKTEQPKTNFTIRKCGKSAAYCRPCNATKTATYRLNNREKYLELKRQARQRHADKHSIKSIRKNWDTISIDEKAHLSCGIYCITIGPKFYVGSAVDFGRRMKDHTRKLGAGKHINAYMQSSFDKYETFDAEVIEFCEPSDLENREQFYIDQWFGSEDCLNLRPDVKTMFGFRHSDETKKALSFAVSAYRKEKSNGDK
jgi:hypothetical protein